MACDVSPVAMFFLQHCNNLREENLKEEENLWDQIEQVLTDKSIWIKLGKLEFGVVSNQTFANKKERERKKVKAQKVFMEAFVNSPFAPSRFPGHSVSFI